MNFKEKIILSNKHHISSALYHLQKVLPNREEEEIVGVQDLKTIREQLKLWERDLYLLIDCS